MLPYHVPFFNQFLFFCIFSIDLNQTHSIIEKAVQYQSGAWQKIVFVVLADKSLRVENVFECVVRLPPSPVSQNQFQPHVWKRRMVYAPSKLFHITAGQKI